MENIRQTNAVGPVVIPISNKETPYQQKTEETARANLIKKGKRAELGPSAPPTLREKTFAIIGQHAYRLADVYDKAGLVAISTISPGIREKLQVDKLKTSLAFEDFSNILRSYMKTDSTEEEMAKFNAISHQIDLFLDSLSTQDFKDFYAQFGTDPIIPSNSTPGFPYRFNNAVLDFLLNSISQTSSSDGRLFSDYAQRNPLLLENAPLSERGRNHFIRILDMYYDFNRPDEESQGATLLMRLIDARDVTATRIFMESLENKANLLHKDEEGKTTLDHAVQSGNPEILALIVR